MDRGLAVRWLLSPFVTALAAGTLFVFCFVIWKYRNGNKQNRRNPVIMFKENRKMPGDESDDVKKVMEEKQNEKSDPKQPEAGASGDYLARLESVIRQRLPIGSSLSDSSSSVSKEKGKELSACHELSVSGDDSRNSAADGNGASRDSSASTLNESQLRPVSRAFSLPNFQSIVRNLCRSRGLRYPRANVRHFENFYLDRRNLLINVDSFNEKPLTRAAISVSLNTNFYVALNKYDLICRSERQLVSRALSPINFPNGVEHCERAAMVDRATSPVKFLFDPRNVASEDSRDDEDRRRKYSLPAIGLIKSIQSSQFETSQGGAANESRDEIENAFASLAGCSQSGGCDSGYTSLIHERENEQQSGLEQANHIESISRIKNEGVELIDNSLLSEVKSQPKIRPVQTVSPVISPSSSEEGSILEEQTSEIQPVLKEATYSPHDARTSATGSGSRHSEETSEHLETFQNARDKDGERDSILVSADLSLVSPTGQSESGDALEPFESSKTEEDRGDFRVHRDVTERIGERGTSTSRTETEEKRSLPEQRQMDRRTGERSVVRPLVLEQSVKSETEICGNGDARVHTSVVSKVSLDERGESIEDTIRELNEIAERSPKRQEEPPPANRLMGLLTRDEERRARAKLLHGDREGEWDRLLRDVLESVSELERWEAGAQRQRCSGSDVSDGDAADAGADPRHQYDSPSAMEEEGGALLSPKGETPTKVKSLRFKLDPDVFDVPSDDSFYDDDEEAPRPAWKRQNKYRAFSSLELGTDDPVRLVSVHASVVPAGQKMVARPVGIDLRVRLTEERQSKRAHVSTSPSQAKRRSPVSDRSGAGWCQELSPVTENVDWRETFSAMPKDPECARKVVPNGILKTPSPRSEPAPTERANPFQGQVEKTSVEVKSPPSVLPKRVDKPLTNGVPWKPAPPRKPVVLLRKKFEPDPEAIERITGYKSALSKPPLPPSNFHRSLSSSIVRNRAELARKQYLDNKAALAGKVDGTKKFEQFLTQAQKDRARIVTSVPDLGAIEKAVSEQWAKERASVSPRMSPAREESPKVEEGLPSRGSTPDDAWSSYVQSCRRHLGRRSQSLSYLETQIDIPILESDDKCHSTGALDEPEDEKKPQPCPEESDLDQSKEELDDSGRAKSEHELRIERSLRSLPLPDWYRRSDKTKTGFLLGSGPKEKRGWAAAKSLASSTSSLASCGLRRPVRSLRSSRENIPWSKSSPDGPSLSLALAKAFRDPYLGWRARTPTSSGVSSSPRMSPPSWGAITTDDEVNGISFDGEDARTCSEDDRRDELPSLDDTGADAITVSMDTGEPVKMFPEGEDTCDDINNMSMDTCELFDTSVVPEETSPQADTGDDIDNLSTDTTEDRGKDPKFKRYSYSQSIYHSEWDDEESRGDRKSSKEDLETSPSSEHNKVIWIESSFVGSRTTTSIVVMPQDKQNGNCHERPASR